MSTESTASHNARLERKCSDIDANFIASFLRFYEIHHILADFGLGGLRALLSDILAQLIRSQHSPPLQLAVNWKSVFCSFFIAELYMTPILLLFFGYLGKTSFSKLQKVFIDQFLFAPFYTAGIIALRLLLVGSVSMNELSGQVLDRLPTAMYYGWLFWIPSKFFLHEFVDLKYHLLLSQFLSLFWNTVLACLM